jgi:sigma-B regulation protein RsbU (phosphoserine phosphatase)
LTRAIIVLLFATIIVASGVAAIVVHFIRRRGAKQFLLWFGFFAALYGCTLILPNPVFRLGFELPPGLQMLLVHLANALTIVAGLLLFKQFYGSGWRSSINWLVALYSVLECISLFVWLRIRSFHLTLPPGTVLIVLVPAVLAVGRLTGYRSKPLPERWILSAGGLAFFIAFSVDRMQRVQFDSPHAGVEPYGFLILIACLGYIGTRRVIADERQLTSMTEEMHEASAIQRAILPRTLPSIDQVRIAVEYSPMTAVAGDFYFFPKAQPGTVRLFVADVMGHGVPAALVASMVKVGASVESRRSSGPAGIVAGLNKTLCDEAAGQFVTVVCMDVDPSAGTGRYSAAAHPAPLLWRRKRQVIEPLAETGLLLGVRREEDYRDYEFSFEISDRLLLCTDGLLEAESVDGRSFGDAMLPAFIRDKQGLAAGPFAAQLLKEVIAWGSRGGRPKQEDDITIMVVDFALPDQKQ